ncbi:MAG: DUF2442 domain-containing protein [Treponema sp.]
MIIPIAVQYLHDYLLLITFSTGEKKIYDAKGDMHTGIFKKLQNKSFFSQARIERGSVVWSDDIDIAPEALYAESVAYNG